MYSYSHDADIIVYNYVDRSAKSTETETISLREAIVSIQCQKTKESPQGSFAVKLKPTRDWGKILTPGSWCLIFMSDKPLTNDDYSNGIERVSVEIDIFDTNTNIISPLKMVGIIMSVRMQKIKEPDGTAVLSFTLSGYDFGYIFSGQIYMNELLRGKFQLNGLLATFSDLSYSTAEDVFGTPDININRVLNLWSKVSGGIFSSFGVEKIKPPEIRMEIPDAIADFFGTDNETLELITPCVGIDRRLGKVFEKSEFSTPLLGEKAFLQDKIMMQNSLWGMLNEYLNSILNEAYCDLHATPSIVGLPAPGPFAVPTMLTPMLIVRQKPFNTPNYNKIKLETQVTSNHPITVLSDLPKTIITSDKVISFDIGYSEHERINFVEINGFLVNGPKGGIDKAGFVALNPPALNDGSVKRIGLRPMNVTGADYGVSRDRLNTAASWRPLLVDWWFNASKFANGTIECIGLSEHIAIGENIMLPDEQILGHIESYTHSFTVNEDDGKKVFRTTIEFSKGIHSDSSSDTFIYIYGESESKSLYDTPLLKGALDTESAIGDDAKKIASYTETNKGGMDVDDDSTFF